MSESSSDPADEWRRVASVLKVNPSSREDVNEALTLVGALRAELDRMEHRLIVLARDAGSSWQEIAASLGLRSRQAAEQRFLRLEAHAEADLGAVRRRLAARREVDARAGANAARLRSAIGDLIDELERTARRTGGRGAAGSSRRAVGRGPANGDAAVLLALTTLRIAVDSAAGPMCDLAALAVTDLDSVPREVRSNGLDAAVGAVQAVLRPILDAIESS